MSTIYVPQAVPGRVREQRTSEHGNRLSGNLTIPLCLKKCVGDGLSEGGGQHDNFQRSYERN